MGLSPPPVWQQPGSWIAQARKKSGQPFVTNAKVVPVTVTTAAALPRTESAPYKSVDSAPQSNKSSPTSSTGGRSPSGARGGCPSIHCGAPSIMFLYAQCLWLYYVPMQIIRIHCRDSALSKSHLEPAPVEHTLSFSLSLSLCGALEQDRSSVAQLDAHLKLLASLVLTP